MSVLIQRVVDKDTIDVIKLDATIAAGLSFPSTVTEHPIEDGSIIADHVRNDPDTVTVTGHVTNTPVSIIGVGADKGRARSATDSLRELRDNKELVRITTDVHVFENMVMTQLDIPRDAPNANALQFTATFQKITKVSTEVTQFPDEDTERRASPAAELGKQTPVESTDEAESQSSYLMRILKGVGVVQ